MNNKMLKESALSSLSGNWLKVIAVILLVSAISFLFGTLTDVFSADIQTELDAVSEQYLNGDIDFVTYVDTVTPLNAQLLPYNLISFVGSLIVMFITLAQVNFFLMTAKNGAASFDNFKSYLKYWWQSFVLYLLIAVKIVLWSLLLIVPGIIKAFSYSMAQYVKAENPELSASECIKRSTELMDGYKGALLNLMISFLGWLLLVALGSSVISFVMGVVVAMIFEYAVAVTIATSIIGSIILTLALSPFTAYYELTVAHFYLIISPKAEPTENVDTSSVFEF